MVVHTMFVLVRPVGSALKQGREIKFNPDWQEIRRQLYDGEEIAAISSRTHQNFEGDAYVLNPSLLRWLQTQDLEEWTFVAIPGDLADKAE